MDELSAKERRERLAFGEQIAELAARAPDEEIKRDLYRAVIACRRRYGFSSQEKLEEILNAIELGASTIADLVRETGFPQQQVDSLTKVLEQHNVIKFERLSLTGNGRPSLIIRIVPQI